MGTRVLICRSAVAAFVQKPTQSSPIAIPPIPVVACVDGRLVDGNIWIVGLWVSSWLSGVRAPLGALRPGRLFGLWVWATTGDVTYFLALKALCRRKTLVFR